MTATTCDTHAAVKALMHAGLASAHAEAITDTVRAAIAEGVATKADIAALKTDIGTLDNRMLKVAIGIVVANAGITFALLELVVGGGG